MISFLELAQKYGTIQSVIARVQRQIDHAKGVLDRYARNPGQFDRYEPTVKRALALGRKRMKELVKYRKTIEQSLRAVRVPWDHLDNDWPTWLTKEGRIIRPWMRRAE